MLDDYRSRGERLLAPLVARLSPGGADRLTWASLVLAGAAGVCFTWSAPSAPHFLVIGGALVLVSGALDALDGMVARATKSASPAGDFLDHALDRFADLFIIGGLAASAFGGFKWGFFAVTGVLLTSYMGTQSAAVGLPRDYRGVLGRADRLVLLSLVPVAQAFLVYAGLPEGLTVPEPFGAQGAAIGVTLIEALLFVLALLGYTTAVQRFSRARFALLAREGRGGPGSGRAEPGSGGAGREAEPPRSAVEPKR